MSGTNSPLGQPQGPQTGQQTGQQAMPLTINIQYVKDLSFEVPGAPGIFTQPQGQPQINLNLDVQARRLDPNQHIYEVVLAIKAEAQPTAAPVANGQAAPPLPTGPVFIAELSYAGVFTLAGVPDNAIEPVLLVECPRLLFPFARNILADVTREGGFPPVLLQPLDFVALWQSRRGPGAAPGQVPTVQA